MLLARALSKVIRIGRLELIDAAGRHHVFGGSAGPSVTVRLHDRALHRRLIVNPRLHVPEAYMDGALTLEEGGIYELLELLARNDELMWADNKLWRFIGRVRRATRRLHQYNPIARSRANVAHHYDLSDQLYDMFLDRDRQYSCAYFLTPDDDIDAAQLNKRRHIASKLLIRPGMKVLDIGCGWGGLALYLASECGADVTGLTLSTEQLKVAQRRAAQAGLSERVHFHLRDYRQEKDQYDRIVSVGMFEHVGVVQYPTFFGQVNALLKPDGVALLHSIGRYDGPATTNPWMRKYIFPGGYSPAISEVVPRIEDARLWVTDIEVLRLHYAKTLKAWRQRFLAHRDEALKLYDERFCRMWEAYLVGAELAFRYGGHLVMQIQMAKAIDTVPLTRDYMFDWERRHRADADDRAA
ncbi:MAG TPA: cyclopropane-fatty-acyl-phospholipid synthase family protein [Stellaceae bacterium]|jgi:cyclopropane-fatty-acyl-phospholipid synthase|nr:cyclopropane-fatty-acyl-phospholipid synthase family protein [Stellaceae bacterium]